MKILVSRVPIKKKGEKAIFPIKGFNEKGENVIFFGVINVTEDNEEKFSSGVISVISSKYEIKRSNGKIFILLYPDELEREYPYKKGGHSLVIGREEYISSLSYNDDDIYIKNFFGVDGYFDFVSYVGISEKEEKFHLTPFQEDIIEIENINVDKNAEIDDSFIDKLFF